MTPSDFYYWLTGFIHGKEEELTPEQVRFIKNKLRAVQEPNQFGITCNNNWQLPMGT